MLFNSHVFIFVFLPIVWLGYFLLQRIQHRLAIIFLCCSSLVFYGYWDLRYLPLLLAACFANFGIAMLLWHNGDRGTSNRLTLAFGVAANIALLAFFKYANFLVDNFNATTNAGILRPDIILPLGLSFFVFQKIAFLVDVSRGVVKDRSFLRYVLFVAFFPQLIAGPIVHHSEVMPQFTSSRLKVSSDLSIGITYFCIGLFKKVVIADNLALIAAPMFSAAASGSSAGFADTWIAALAYALQIYFDFSGYSDMAIGLGRMFGIALPVNFASPYKATSLIDFWRRWHITLSRFLRDYLYVPLGGNRASPTRRYFNVLLTMAIGGFWHGASWNFLLWGALHGALIVANGLWRNLLPGMRIPSVAGWFLTFMAVLFCWVPFRSADLAASVTIWSSMVGIGSSNALCESACTIATGQLGFVIACLAACVCLPASHQLMRNASTTISSRGYPASEPNPSRLQWRATKTWAFYAALLFTISLMSLSNVSEFIYFQF